MGYSSIHSFPHQRGVCGTSPHCSMQGMRNRQLLSLPSEEREGATPSLSHGARQGFTGTGERSEDIIKYIIFAARGQGKKWQSFLPPMDMLHLAC